MRRSTAGRSVAKPEFARCAGVYGALGRLQERFGSEHTLVGEVYPNLLRIDFSARRVLRISFSRDTRAEHVLAACRALAAVVEELAPRALR